jgi:hypothetical protein
MRPPVPQKSLVSKKSAIYAILMLQRNEELTL